MNTFDDTFFKRMWLTAWATAICGTPIVYSLRHSQPWVAAVPLAAGLAIFALAEARRGTWSEVWRALLADEADLLEHARSLAEQLREARSSVLVSFNTSGSAFGQLDLFERKVAAVTEEQKGLSLIKSELGQEFAFVTWHRFEELLLNEVVPDADKAADNALAKALANAPKDVARELAELLDKKAREIIKQDFRTSAVSLIAEATRRVALRLDAEAAAAAHAKKLVGRKSKARK